MKKKLRTWLELWGQWMGIKTLIITIAIILWIIAAGIIITLAAMLAWLIVLWFHAAVVTTIYTMLFVAACCWGVVAWDIEQWARHEIKLMEMAQETEAARDPSEKQIGI